jgi:hypothetical protein
LGTVKSARDLLRSGSPQSRCSTVVVFVGYSKVVSNTMLHLFFPRLGGLSEGRSAAYGLRRSGSLPVLSHSRCRLQLSHHIPHPSPSQQHNYHAPSSPSAVVAPPAFDWCTSRTFLCLALLPTAHGAVHACLPSPRVRRSHRSSSQFLRPQISSITPVLADR